MATAAQALANAANAKYSTGPRTEAGKSKSSQNSLSHGLNAASDTLFSHSPQLAADFAAFRAQLLSVPTQGVAESLAFDRWSFSAFQATRSRQLEALAESDARLNFGDEQLERRWQRMVQTRLRLEREAAAARKEFFALQDRRLSLEAETAAQEKRTQQDKMLLEILRDKAMQRDREYQNALLAYQSRLQTASQRSSLEPPPLRERNDDLLILCAPDMAAVHSYNEMAVATLQP